MGAILDPSTMGDWKRTPCGSGIVRLREVVFDSSFNLYEKTRHCLYIEEMILVIVISNGKIENVGITYLCVYEDYLPKAGTNRARKCWEDHTKYSPLYRKDPSKIRPVDLFKANKVWFLDGSDKYPKGSYISSKDKLTCAKYKYAPIKDFRIVAKAVEEAGGVAQMLSEIRETRVPLHFYKNRDSLALLERNLDGIADARPTDFTVADFKQLVASAHVLVDTESLGLPDSYIK